MEVIQTFWGYFCYFLQIPMWCIIHGNIFVPTIVVIWSAAVLLSLKRR